MDIPTLLICVVVIVTSAHFLPESFRSNLIIDWLAWLGEPFFLLIQFCLQNSIGRFIPTAQQVEMVKISKADGVGENEIFLAWEGIPNPSWWRMVGYDVEVSPSCEEWTRVYSGRETDHLVIGLEERRLYFFRVRGRVGGKASDWFTKKEAVWTLCERTPQGGATGPLPEGEYSWFQTDSEVEVVIPKGKGRVQVVVKESSISVSVDDQVLLSGILSKRVISDECFWTIEDNDRIVISLVKKEEMENWSSVIKGHPPINLF